MADISKTRLRAKLVVLSRCHSARGQIRIEGVIGLARAFIRSGARSVLAARWAWLTQPQSSLWIVSTNICSAVKAPVSLSTRPGSGWEITALTKFLNGRHLWSWATTWHLILEIGRCLTHLKSHDFDKTSVAEWTRFSKAQNYLITSL